MSFSSRCLVATTLLCLGCPGDPPVYLGSGTYVVVEEGTTTSVEPFEGVTFEVDVDAMTLEVFEDGALSMSAELTSVPEDAWQIACPTNFKGVFLETFAVSDPIVLDGVDLPFPLVYPDGCVGDQGTVGVNAWLSSWKTQDVDSNLQRGSTFYLERR